ncbi:hypothetical protein CPB85DRAFT_1419665 [Mucidula mucida]|nr:hypothetical protein CPB85DRAFT_1419665 [Mucidula mucida]
MIVEHLRSIAGNIVLVIVCRYNQNHDSLRETHAFICCLLRQLLQLDATSSVPPSLLELYRKDIYPSEDGVRTLLIEAARLISRPIFIVLDALDECPLGFDLVAAIESLGHDFNLLITSRDVFSQIKDYPSLPIRAADRDILALVDSKISKLRWVCEDEDLQSAVRSEVVARANGMFLLASLTLWELEHNVASKVDVRRVLTSIPVSLDDAYHQIFVRIGKQGARMKQLALQAIMWIYADFGNPVDWNKLYWWELRLVFACNMISMSGSDFPEPPSANTIVDACGGLVSAPRNVAFAPAFIRTPCSRSTHS